MSQSTPKTSLSRRTVLSGTAAAAATAMTFGLPGSAAAKALDIGSKQSLADARLCAAHHRELSEHLGRVLNASYIEARMKNKTLSTAHCPHCKVAIAPQMKTRAAFAALA